jgi:hypothetical protein
MTLRGVRLRLLPSSSLQNAAFEPIFDGEVFPSVSARAPRRCDANLWTSGNRAFAVDATSAFMAMMAITAERSLCLKGVDSQLLPLGDRVPIDAIQLLVHNLAQLADREFAEATLLVGAAAWESSVNDARFLNGSWRAFRASVAGIVD